MNVDFKMFVVLYQNVSTEQLPKCS